jgi:hypothetical protein
LCLYLNTDIKAVNQKLAGPIRRGSSHPSERFGGSRYPRKRDQWNRAITAILPHPEKLVTLQAGKVK